MNRQSHLYFLRPGASQKNENPRPNAAIKRKPITRLHYQFALAGCDRGVPGSFHSQTVRLEPSCKRKDGCSVRSERIFAILRLLK